MDYPASWSPELRAKAEEIEAEQQRTAVAYLNVNGRSSPISAEQMKNLKVYATIYGDETIPGSSGRTHRDVYREVRRQHAQTIRARRGRAPHIAPSRTAPRARSPRRAARRSTRSSAASGDSGGDPPGSTSRPRAGARLAVVA